MAKSKNLLEMGQEVKENYYLDLLDRLSNGETLTAQEHKIMKEIEEEISSTPKAFDPFLVPTSILARFFEISPRSIQKWHKNGECPQVKRGWWNLKDVLQWWLLNIYQTNFEQTDETIQQFRRQYEKWRAEKAEIQVKEMKGDLVPRTMLVKDRVNRIMVIKAGLLRLCELLPQILEGKSQFEMREKIDEQVWQMLDNYSRIGQFWPEEE